MKGNTAMQFIMKQNAKTCSSQDRKAIPMNRGFSSGNGVGPGPVNTSDIMVKHNSLKPVNNT